MYAILAFATLTKVSTLAHRIWLIIFILLRLDIISGLRGIVYQFLGKQKSCLFRNNSSIIAYYFYFVKPISASHLRQYCTDCLDYSTPSCILSRVFTFWFWIRKVRLRVGGGLRKCARYGFSPLGTGYIVVSVRVRLSQATDQIRTTSPYDMALRTSERLLWGPCRIFCRGYLQPHQHTYLRSV